MPILRNPELSIHSLISYCNQLAQRSFVVAPDPILLAFFITQRRHFHDQPCRIPESDDYDLMRVASRAKHLRVQDIAFVTNWRDQSGFTIDRHHKWSKLIDHARTYFAHQSIELELQAHEGWHFFCREQSWRGLTITPITTPLAMWRQGLNQGNCLYKLRYECNSIQPSRFFCVTRADRPLATLELAWRPPKASDRGMDRLWGQWFVQDLRLSYNRIADEALLKTMKDFAWQYNIWAKRPGRTTPAIISDTLDRVRRICGRSGLNGWRPSFSDG